MINNKAASGLGTLALVFLISGAVDSIRNLPTTALFGSTLIFFIIFSAIVFLIPVSMISAELSATYPERSGVYHWVSHAFGERLGFLTVWLQWINTLVWFPTILSFIVGTAAYLINPALIENKIYLVTAILIIFWTMTLLNLKGVQTSTRIANIFVTIGVFFPMMLIIVLAFIYLLQGKALQIEFSYHALLPSLFSISNWISLTAIMTAFLGIELSAVHIKNIDNPQRTFPKAMFFAIILILATMILGSLAIALIIPKNEINLVAGVMQTFVAFLSAYHLAWFIPIVTILLLFGSLGNMTSWIISPARGMLQAAEHGYLPMYFTKTNQNGVASRLLILQAVIVSLVCLVFVTMPSVNGSYWLLTALSTQLYVMMYVFMFFAALSLKKNQSGKNQSFQIPGGRLGHGLVCLLGLFGCAITLLVGFIPPAGINVGSILNYELFFCGGLLVMISPVLLFYFYKYKTNKLVPASTLIT